MNRLFLCLTLAAACIAGGALADPPSAPPLGESRLLAPIPADPGFPEAIALRDGIAYVTGPAQFGYLQQPKVLGFDLRTGALVKEIAIQGENPSAPQALPAAAFDRQGRLYTFDLQQGLLRIDVDTGAQEVYAPPLPVLFPRGALPNELIFDKNGDGYLTDSFQGTIWKVPAGGGSWQPWFQDPRLLVSFGPNGMRLDHTGKTLYFVSSLGNFGEGEVYTLPFVDHPQASDLQVFHAYAAGEVPDGITFGKSKKLYVALAGSNQISVLRPDGTEEARYGGLIQNPSGPPLPYANPSAFAIDDRTGSLIVVNHAIFFPSPQPFALFTVYVDDRAEPLFEPNLK